jgi:hypothetical protein
MTVFVDTSALYAVLDRDDANQGRAKEEWGNAERVERAGDDFDRHFGEQGFEMRPR